MRSKTLIHKYGASDGRTRMIMSSEFLGLCRTVWPVSNIYQPDSLPEPLSSHMSGQAIGVKLVGEMPMFYQTPSDTMDKRKTEANIEPQDSVKPLISTLLEILATPSRCRPCLRVTLGSRGVTVMCLAEDFLVSEIRKRSQRGVHNS